MDIAMQSINALLSNGWRVSEMKDLSFLLWKDGIGICAAIATTQMRHWEEEYHEILILGSYPMTIAQDGIMSCPEEETYRFYHWLELKKFLEQACGEDFSNHGEAFDKCKER